MPAPTSSPTPADLLRLLLKSLQSNDREAIVTYLAELGLWVSVTPEPLPLPEVSVVSLAALTTTLNELQTAIRQHRETSANIVERDSSALAAVIERNTEMLETVARALAMLTPDAGFLMVEG